MDNHIFRKVSLERLRSPEQLDQLMKVTSLKAWIALFAIGLLLITVIIWGIIGQIPIRVSGEGILLTGGGIHNIVHNYEGKITDISVRTGDRVKAGDVVARIEIYNIIEQIIKLKEQFKQSQDPAKKNALQLEIKNLQRDYEYQATVTTPYEGKVIEIKLNRGDILKPGQPIISIEQSGAAIRKLEGILFVSAYAGKKLRPGMEVKISPSFVKKEEYGFMLGKVISVSEFPVTSQKMISILGSRQLAEMFSQNGAPIEVKVDLSVDEDTVSGFKWTTPAGPPVKINSGTLCSAYITVDSQRPIEMVVPIKIGNDE